MNGNFNLEMRFGESHDNPTEEQMKQAIRELFHEDQLGLGEGDCAEHPNAWLTFGFQNGDKWSVVTLDLCRTGLMVFTRYEDQDDAEPLFTQTKRDISESDAFRLWQLLASGEIDSLKREQWNT